MVIPAAIGAALISGGAAVGSGLLTAGTDRRNLDLQRSTFGQNFEMQQQILAYEKQLQGKIFDREDDSIQRRVADLKAAGLSPTLAAGQGARAGAIVKPTVPQRGTPQKETRGLEMISGALLQLTGKMSDISKTLAETSYIEAQEKRTTQTTNQEQRIFPAKLGQILNQNMYAGRTLDDRVRLANVEVKRQTTQGRIDAYNEVMAHIDANLKEWMFEKVRDQGLSNPREIEVLVAQLLLDIKKHDFQFYKKLGQPVQGNVSWPTAILGGVSSLGGVIRSGINTAIERGQEIVK